MYEHRGEALLPRRLFLLRVAWSALLATGFIGGSLLIGMVGYRITEGLSWLEAFLNASMILTGMGRQRARKEGKQRDPAFLKQQRWLHGAAYGLILLGLILMWAKR